MWGIRGPEGRRNQTSGWENWVSFGFHPLSQDEFPGDLGNLHGDLLERKLEAPMKCVCVTVFSYWTRVTLLAVVSGWVLSPQLMPSRRPRQTRDRGATWKMVASGDGSWLLWCSCGKPYTRGGPHLKGKSNEKFFPRAFRESPILPMPSFWTSSLQNWERINFCCF